MADAPHVASWSLTVFSTPIWKVNCRLALAAALAMTMLTGCGTVRSSEQVQADSPKVFSGTRLDLAALSADHETLDEFARFGIEAPLYPGVDLPLSLIGDTLLLPYSGWYVATEPFLKRG